MSDWQRKAWSDDQKGRDAMLEKQREREKKARERSARNAQRKIARLKAKLTEIGEISEFEEEFAGSVAERLDKYGAAFADPSKGRPGDALSASQKQVVARMNKKAKEARKAAKLAREAATDDAGEEAATSTPGPKPTSAPLKAVPSVSEVPDLEPVPRPAAKAPFLRLVPMNDESADD